MLSFGNHTDEVTNLKSFSPGVTIKGQSRAPVKAVASGMVAYVGNLRGYGNFVIINHDDEYYTTYAGLGEANVVQDSYVSSGSRIAHAGEDGVIKFELRQGSQPLDPIEWITIDAY